MTGRTPGNVPHAALEIEARVILFLTGSDFRQAGIILYVSYALLVFYKKIGVAAPPFLPDGDTVFDRHAGFTRAEE